MSGEIVILGGTGFIGSAIARICARDGHSCVPLASADCDLTDSDACAETLPSLVDGNAVVYAAGIPRAVADTQDAFEANLAMVRNTVSAMRKSSPASMVFISSVEVYGIPVELPVNEETEINPATPYAAGKYEAEHVLREWHKATRVPLAILRLPGVYGAGDGGRSVVGTLVAKAGGGRPFPLTGSGCWRRDYIWVDDIGRVVAALTETDFEELTLNVATGRSLSISEVIDRVSALYGPISIEAAGEGAPDGHLEFDVSGLRSVLPDVELTDLKEGLEAYGESGA